MFQLLHGIDGKSEFEKKVVNIANVELKKSIKVKYKYWLTQVLKLCDVVNKT